MLFLRCLYDVVCTVMVITNFRCVRLGTVRDRQDILHIISDLSFESRCLFTLLQKNYAFCKKLHVITDLGVKIETC